MNKKNLLITGALSVLSICSFAQQSTIPNAAGVNPRPPLREIASPAKKKFPSATDQPALSEKKSAKKEEVQSATDDGAVKYTDALRGMNAKPNEYKKKNTLKKHASLNEK